MTLSEGLTRLRTEGPAGSLRVPRRLRRCAVACSSPALASPQRDEGPYGLEPLSSANPANHTSGAFQLMAISFVVQDWILSM